jgi:hypothetical protein
MDWYASETLAEHRPIHYWKVLLILLILMVLLSLSRPSKVGPYSFEFGFVFAH